MGRRQLEWCRRDFGSRETRKLTEYAQVMPTHHQDKPTLHLGEHHLLHGKMVNLQKPYAVIRKATGDSGGTTLEGDISDEEGAMEEEVPSASAKKRKTSSKLQKRKDEEEEEEEDPPLFAPEPGILPSTPSRDNAPASSSPFYPSSAPRDYSSELDPASSPPVWDDEVDDEEDEEREAEKQRIADQKMKRDKAREKRKRDQKERTRHYEVVGIVRKKVVFALR